MARGLAATRGSAWFAGSLKLAGQPIAWPNTITGIRKSTSCDKVKSTRAIASARVIGAAGDVSGMACYFLH
jgi:hypothetical protein